LAAFQCIVGANAKLSVEPEFPRLFGDFAGVKRVKIVSEYVSEGGLYTTSEEYLDYDAGRAALVVETHNRNSDRKFVYSDINLSGLYLYQPYRCNRYESSAVSSLGLVAGDSLAHWFTSSFSADQLGLLVDDERSGTRLDTETKHLHLFNVAAAWLFAQEADKKFEGSILAHYSEADVALPTYTWVVGVEKQKLLLAFSFVGGASPRDEQLKADQEASETENLILSSIRVGDWDTGKLSFAVTVVEVDYALDSYALTHLLQLPVGFGCLTDDGRGGRESRGDLEAKLAESGLMWAEYDLSGARLELEVSAHNVRSEWLESMLVELAHTEMVPGAHRTDQSVTMVRVKQLTSRGGAQKDQMSMMPADVKIISNYFHNVRYKIDLLTGQCSPSHIAKGEKVDDDENLTLKFSNSLKLSLHRNMLELLFENNDQFQWIRHHVVEEGEKRSKKVYHHLEKTIEDWPPSFGETRKKENGEPKVARLVRSYLEKVDGYGRRESAFLKLVDVKLLVFDAETKSHLLEEYRLNLIDEEPLSEEQTNLWQLFDVSRDCYLNNELMKAGRDFAWLELSYPIEERHLRVLANNVDSLRAAFYEKFIDQTLSGFRIPRVDFLFTSSGVEARFLALNVPPLELIYEPIESMSILVEVNSDLSELAPDLHHCAQLCRLYKCWSFTFCRKTHACRLGSLPASLSGEISSTDDLLNQRLVPMSGCTTYTSFERQPELGQAAASTTATATASTPALQSIGLEQFVAMLRQLDALAQAGVPPPPPPEELSASREESGLSFDDYRARVEAYQKTLDQFMWDYGQLVPQANLVMVLNGRMLVSVPSQFRLENDPLQELLAGDTGDAAAWLYQSQDDSLDQTQLLGAPVSTVAFHKGLSLTKFNLNAFLTNRPQTAGLNAQLFSQLSFDQCSSACLDAKCGSFSFCTQRKECILTDLKTLNEASARRLLEEDDDCFVVQRNFLRDYVRFPNNKVPMSSIKTTTSQLAGESAALLEPSDCAFECSTMASEENSSEKCLSFQWCSDSKGKTISCHYQPSRYVDLYSSILTPGKEAQTNDNNSVTCDHYLLSYLADYVHIEHSMISESVLKQNPIRTTTHPGKSVDICAQLCNDPLNDCTAFQFCTKTQTMAAGAQVFYVRECTLLQGKLVADEMPGELIVDEKQGKLASDGMAGRVLAFSQDCSLFALRQLTSRRHLQDLALGNVMTLEEKSQIEEQSKLNNRVGGFFSARLTWTQCCLMFVLLALSSAFLTFAIVYVRERRISR